MENKHIALPLKYRPMTFEDVVGQEHVVKTLRNAIGSGRVANAYLFIGPRGIGKTTMSRIFAKALNCINPKGVEPCGECDNCREIAAGNSLDVTELDAASHNKVEDVKPIIESVQFKPTSSKYKIFIIDECHMLSNAAWNALLKTLEEPPEYVRFIFATTEGDKVLATIISRCQRFDLRRILTHDIVSRLKYICEKEGIDAEEDALLAIARGAEGGMRDALSSLDQLISFKGNKITEEDALGVFGLVSRSALEELAGAILKGDAAKILESVEMFDSAGKNMRRLAGELLSHFRNLVVLQALGANSKSLEATEDQIKVLSEQAKGVDPSRVFQVCDQIAQMEDKLRYVLSVRTLIEMSLIKASKIATTATIEELMRAVKKMKGQGIGQGQGQGEKPAVKIEASKNLQERPIKPVASHSLPSLSELSKPKAPAPSLPTPSTPPPPQPVAKTLDNREILDDKLLNDILMDGPGAQVTDIRTKRR
ncbi:MAG: DNA polymerase III subunit gamma/tau [Kiritimatiellae bacterium]|nr:DNA polymerase III subunit gamma/tau [Kiritimatiellia bacterium]